MTEKEHYEGPATILMADDDPDDLLLTQEALSESNGGAKFATVSDGEELMDYLRRHGKYANLAGQPLPCLILLDLNMPRMDGRQALKAIRDDPVLRKTPIVVLSTSAADEDIVESYNLGANSFIVKPAAFKDMIEIMGSVSKYWFSMVKLPRG